MTAINHRVQRRAVLLVGLIGLLAGPIGCGPTPLDTRYGRTRGPSVNGTGTLAERIRQAGHRVRTVYRLDKRTSAAVDVIVRFAPYPGPPSKEEGEILLAWLDEQPGRKLIYIPQDFDGAAEAYTGMIAVQSKDAPPDQIAAMKKWRAEESGWVGELPRKPAEIAPAESWFATSAGTGTPTTCKRLGGDWAVGVDAGTAAISRHEVFKVDDGTPILLSGDDEPLVVEWSRDSGGQALAVANASFLLNSALVNKARRPLMGQLVAWIGQQPRRVAFLEGRLLANADPASRSQSPFHLFTVEPFGWIALHLLSFLFLLALAHAVRLGRARPAGPIGVERPSAHPEALGALLARSGRTDHALALLDEYRRWRQPSPVAGRPGRRSPPSRGVPPA